MRTVSVRLSDLERAVVPIGFVGENQHTQVRIDCLKLYEEYPHAAASLTVKPPKGDSYPAVVVRDGNTVVWEITDSDLIYDGNGEIQLSFTVDEVVAKSYVGRIKISRSITPTGEVPEPLDDFLTRAGAALTAIPETIAVALQEAKDSGEFDGYSPTVVVTEITGGHQVTVTDVNGDHVFLVMDGVDGDPGTPGFSPSASVSKVGKKATISITDKDGTTTAEVNDGEDGQDGFSPSASVSKSGTKATISITDKNGTTTAEVSDGTDGTPGQDGYSPTATVTKSGDTATISITDKNGTTTAQVSDGQDGETGATPVISIGTVSTLTPGSDATASMDTTDPEHPVLSLGIPEGEPGEVTEAELFDATHGRWNEEGEPYLFRASGGDASVYEWEKDTLVGGTVAWNQLAPAFLSENGWTSQKGNIEFGTNSVTFTSIEKSTAQAIKRNNADGGLPLIKGHKYYISFYALLSQSSQIWVQSMDAQWAVSAAYVSASTKTNITNIFESTRETGGNAYFGIYVGYGSNNGLDIGETVTISNLIVIDLTQMFGTTIADYIYTLESGSAGAGIAWLKSHGFMTKPYYAYDAGTLMSVKAEAHKTVGFNQWDEETESGLISNDGTIESDSRRIVSKNYIAIVPNTSYYVQGFINGRAAYYDADKNFVAYEGSFAVSHNFTTPANAHYMKFSPPASYGTTYNHDICINLSSSRNGEYEPYTSHTYDLGSDELRGLFMLDSNYKLYCNGDTKTSDGTINRRYRIVDLGTLNWGYNSTYTMFIAEVSGIKEVAGKGCVCSKYATYNAWITDQWFVNNDKFLSNAGNDAYIRIKDTAYSDAATFKTAMSGVYLVCERATPTTESADPFTNPQAVSPYGTEEYTDSRAVPIPVGHETKYLMNPYQYVEELTKPTEDDLIANNNITSGSYFIIGNRLFKASSAIASGSAIIPGSNCVETNLAEALNTLQ